jgi:hypothetical protein
MPKGGQLVKKWKYVSDSFFFNITFLKFMFIKKATKIDETFNVDLTLCRKCYIDGKDFVNFCGLHVKHKPYH